MLTIKRASAYLLSELSDRLTCSWSIYNFVHCNITILQSILNEDETTYTLSTLSVTIPSGLCKHWVFMSAIWVSYYLTASVLVWSIHFLLLFSAHMLGYACVALVVCTFHSLNEEYVCTVYTFICKWIYFAYEVSVSHQTMLICNSLYITLYITFIFVPDATKYNAYNIDTDLLYG